MTREKQIKLALDELKPLQDAHAQCKRDIDDALDAIEWNGLNPKPYSTKTKNVVKQLVAALTRARNLHNQLVPLDDYGIVSPLDLENLNGQIAFYEEWRDERPDSLYRTSFKQQAAVKEARALILKYCEGNKKDYSATRKNKWWRLSAILFGKKIDLLRHMRALKSRPDPL